MIKVIKLENAIELIYLVELKISQQPQRSIQKSSKLSKTIKNAQNSSYQVKRSKEQYQKFEFNSTASTENKEFAIFNRVPGSPKERRINLIERKMLKIYLILR